MVSTVRPCTEEFGKHSDYHGENSTLNWSDWYIFTQDAVQNFGQNPNNIMTINVVYSRIKNYNGWYIFTLDKVQISGRILVHLYLVISEGMKKADFSISIQFNSNTIQIGLLKHIHIYDNNTQYDQDNCKHSVPAVSKDVSSFVIV